MNSVEQAFHAAESAASASPSPAPPVIDVEVQPGKPQTAKTAHRTGSFARLKAAAMFPFIWLAAVISQTLRGLAFTAVVIAVSGLSAVLVYDLFLTPVASVTFRHGEVAEKGWFANLLWRNDSTKTFNVETQKSLLNGTSAAVTARRANGETTTLGNDGIWHLLKK